MYSPTIRSQYAYRHPTSPETTVRFNDFLFAAHGAFMCVILYSQFYSWVWGFRVGARQKASKAALGIFWGCVLAILVVSFLAQVAGKDSGYDPSGWAWIDVVSQPMHGNIRMFKLTHSRDIRTGLCEAHYGRRQIHPSGLGQFQAEIDRRLEHISNAARFRRWLVVNGAVGSRCVTPGRLERHHR